ncbi:MAG: penicillin-binding protein 2 [Candidatus Vogelbacteria bacterium]|nr:penicillin-binding protein 2 [Candidatus Vogelbacteria bacterium]
MYVVILVARLFYLQVIQGEEFTKMADRQYVKPVADVFSRGSIYFQEKDGNLISAATIKTNYILAVNPNIITEPEFAYALISPLVTVPHDDFIAKAVKLNDPYEPIAKIDNDELVQKIRDLKIPGVNLYKENIRFYPADRLASHVLGIVAQSKDEGNKFAGRYGVERSYEDILKRSASSLYVNFFAEIFSNLSQKSTDLSAGDLILTIEPNVENFLSKTISDLDARWDADLSAGIVIDPTSGKIFAMSSLPDFSPNNFRTEKSVAVFRNSIVEDVFEMGSIVKPLTLSAGIDAGVITPKTKYNDKGFVILNGKRIENHDGKRMGEVDMQAVIDNSLNTGAVYVMEKLGRDKFRTYMKKFGLGEKTGIDLPNETGGLITNLDSKYEIDYATSAFGQGMALSPIGATRALGAIANGGILIRPYIVDRIVNKAGISKETLPSVKKRVIRASTSEQMTDMLVHAFDYGLVGGKYKLKQYSIAAKTGTAQIPDGKGGYGDKTLHSFFGYFPAYSPKFLVLLYMVNPKNGATFSSDTMSGPFTNLAKFLLNYYEVPPDRNLINLQ